MHYKDINHSYVKIMSSQKNIDELTRDYRETLERNRFLLQLSEKTGITIKDMIKDYSNLELK